jgi:hypothetical protein
MKRRRSIIRSVAFCALLALTPVIVPAQVNIFPKRLMMSPKERSREMELNNTSDIAYEISTHISYGIWRGDSTGSITLDTVTTSPENDRSCAPWTKIFPREMVILPHTTRKLRLMVIPPGELADGEHFARVFVAITEVKPPAPPSDDTTNITFHLRNQMIVVLPVIFRKGRIETALTLDSVQVHRTDTSTGIVVDIRVGGNSGYRGTLSGILTRIDGSLIDTVSALCISEAPSSRVHLTFPPLVDGDYSLALEGRTEAPGTLKEIVIQAPPVARSYRLSVSPSHVVVTPKVE